MKIEQLLPKVKPQHAPYLGYEDGQKINDHDAALGYVLEYDAGALPSFGALPPAQQHSIQFTQAKLGFNHGWLVQAEAPPGALFTQFKSEISKGGVTEEDVAFYFVHWLTDLAGAVPTPLRGAEKFVVAFPHAVLSTFIRSFPMVQQLAFVSQTELLEAYLKAVWAELPGFGAVPSGDEAIALLRLVVQAQSPANQLAVRNAFYTLPASQQRLLSVEMARTGVHGQQYASAPAPGGPAFLVYYSPAFVRGCAQTDPSGALSILAETYRAARRLWPLGEDEASSSASVIVRIDQLKSGTVADARDAFAHGYCWVLSRKNAKEAIVEKLALSDLAGLLADESSSRTHVLLPIWRAAADGDSFTRVRLDE